MSNDAFAPEILARQFAQTRSERKRWRRTIRRTGDERTFKLLKRIEEEHTQRQFEKKSIADVSWLIKYRFQLRWAIRQTLLEPIKLYLADCPEEMRPLAVWLWGKCADRFRLYGLSAFCIDRSPKVFKHVAKALRRLEAWTLLNGMAMRNPGNAKIQWFASAPTTHHSFAERLRHFMSNVDDSPANEVAAPSRMPFSARDRSWEPTPPKSVLFIRRMLRRIRHWVRWGVR